VLSASWLRLDSGVRSAFLSAIPSSIYAPIAQHCSHLTGIPQRTTDVPVGPDQRRVDRCDFGCRDRIQLIGGVRYQTVQVSTGIAIGRSDPGYDQSAVTPSWQPHRPGRGRNVASTATSSRRWSRAPIAGAGLTNAGPGFPPFVSTQFEVGRKLDLGTFGATLSCFQITRAEPRS
jgi:hypothetical protein